MKGEKALACSFVAILGSIAPAQQPDRAPANTIFGRLVDDEAAPVANAAVGLFAMEEFVDTTRLLAQPQATSKSDGTFALAVAAPPRHGVVAIAAEGLQACVLTFHGSAVANGFSCGQLVLPRGAKLVGRVRGVTGEGLPGVRIRVESAIPERFGDGPRLLAGACSDAKGIFVVPCVAPSGLRLVAEADGHRCASRLVAVESPIDLTLEATGFVRGKVVDAEGRPVPGAILQMATVETPEALPTRRSGPDGTFALTVPKRGAFRVTAQDESAPPLQFRSDLLHGAADDVVVRPWTNGPAARRTIEVVVVDAATKAPISDFTAGRVDLDPRHLQIAVLHARRLRKPYRDRAVLVEREVSSLRAVLVEAEGYGFEVAVIPAQLDGPLVVALGPEAILKGRVVDAETGKPMAGVAVCALPTGSSTGGLGATQDICPLSDADGRYVVRGLRPGEYGVQAHAEGRAASKVVSVTLAAGAENAADLEVPPEQWIEVEVEGKVPDRMPCTLTIGSAVVTYGRGSGFKHHVAEPQPLALARPGTHRFGPVGPGHRKLQLVLPSRTRVGVGTRIDLADVLPGDAVHVVLPDLDRAIARGRIDVPAGFPCERLGVLASTTTKKGAKKDLLRRFTDRPNVAGVDASGCFAIDLPAGDYCFQLADLETGILFHTEEQDLAVGSEPIVLRPVFRWLEIACAPQAEGGEVALHSFGVSLHRPRNGAKPAFLMSWNAPNETESGTVPWRIGAARVQRWLVPAGWIDVRANQDNALVAAAELVVDGPEERIALTIPPPPSDEEPLRRETKR